MADEVNSIVCDEMIDPLVDKKLEKRGLKIHSPEPSESDEEILEVAEKNEAPVLTRDKDFVRLHQEKTHYGIIFDKRMHYRTAKEIISALESLFGLTDKNNLKNTLIRLKSFTEEDFNRNDLSGGAVRRVRKGIFINTHTRICTMASKTISLKEESYERLKKEKERGESFSDVVIKLTEDSKRDFSNLIGRDVDFSWEEVKKSRERKGGDERREKLLSGH